jgi:hypothetical protein
MPEQHENHAWLLKQGWRSHGRGTTTLGSNRLCYSKRLPASAILLGLTDKELRLTLYVSDHVTWQALGLPSSLYPPGGPRYEVEIQYDNPTMTMNTTFFTLFNDTLQLKLPHIELFAAHVFVQFMTTDFAYQED